jgi:hypothetical protein
MALLIDPPRWPAHGTVYSHLVSDVSYAELHAFALGNGLPDRAFDRDHYDVPLARYELLIAAGAEPVESRVLLYRLIEAGLRLRRPRPGIGDGSTDSARTDRPGGCWQVLPS